MFEVITEAQKHEIENLAEDHHDALIAFGYFRKKETDLNVVKI